MMTDSVITQKAKANLMATDSVQNFERIVAENESKIFNTIYSFVGDYEDALDLTQETFICAYRHIGKFRHESSISTWLYRIAINLCKRDYKKQKRRNSIVTDSLDDPKISRVATNQSSETISADEVIEVSEQEDIIRHEIYALPKKHRTVIVLKYLQDLSYEEIADIIGCNIGTVKSRLSRAKEKLKVGLERVMEADDVKL